MADFNPQIDAFKQQIEDAGAGVASQGQLPFVDTSAPQVPQIQTPQYQAPDPTGSNYETMYGGAGAAPDWRTDFANRFGLTMTSGDRTPEHNAAVNGVKNSYHLQPGYAGDFVFKGPNAAQKYAQAAAWAHTRGAVEVLIHNAGSGQHLHVVFDPNAYGGQRVTGVAPQGAGRFNASQLGLTPAEAWIVQHESGGNTYAKNPKSSAFGLGQLVLSNRQKYLGANYATTDARLQLQAFRSYVRDRYGSAENAVRFWQSHGWY